MDDLKKKPSESLRGAENVIAKLQKRRKAIAEQKIAGQLTLPFWGEEQRGVPNGTLRSCLFAALGRGKRQIIDREIIHSMGNSQITYTGVNLDQDHLTLWETLLHLAREQELGEKCEVTIYQLLKLLGKQDTGGNRDVLLKRLDHLQATAIEIKQGQYSFTGSLVERAYRDEETGLVVIVMHKNLVSLFQPDQFTKISWKIRQSLRRPLAKWLHGFYSTHANPFDVSVEFIHRLSGSEEKIIRNFRNQRLIPSLRELEEVCTRFNEYFSWAILPNGLVRVSRSPNKSLLTNAECGDQRPDQGCQ
jgi:hypothetical protein